MTRVCWCDSRRFRVAQARKTRSRRHANLCIHHRCRGPFLGYTCTGTIWSRTTPQGRSAINLQRSRYGFTAGIPLRFLLPNGTAPTHSIWAQDADIKLENFTTVAVGHSLANIAYLDIIENPARLDLPMHILATHALP